jgi:hypothetical protein
VDTSEKYVKICESAKEIQWKWNCRSGDFVYDPAFEEVQVLLYYPAKDYTEYVWLPRQDQLQEICINFYMQNLSISRHEAFFHFLGLYASWIKDVHNIICNIGGEYK